MRHAKKNVRIMCFVASLVCAGARNNTCIAFRNWMNSLGVDPYVGNLYEDLRDGIILIQVSCQLRSWCAMRSLTLLVVIRKSIPRDSRPQKGELPPMESSRQRDEKNRKLQLCCSTRQAAQVLCCWN